VIRILTGCQGEVLGTSFSPHDKYVAAVDSDGVLVVWDVNTGRQIFKYKRIGGEAWHVKFTPDAQKVVLANDDRELCTFDFLDGKQIGFFPSLNGLFGLTIGFGGKLVITGDSSGRIYLLHNIGYEFGPGIVTPTKLYNHETKEFESLYSVRCSWCGHLIHLPEEKIKPNPQKRLICEKCKNELIINPQFSS